LSPVFFVQLARPNPLVRFPVYHEQEKVSRQVASQSLLKIDYLNLKKATRARVSREEVL
jgi:hypothetical protein